MPQRCPSRTAIGRARLNPSGQSILGGRSESNARSYAPGPESRDGTLQVSRAGNAGKSLTTQSSIRPGLRGWQYFHWPRRSKCLPFFDQKSKRGSCTGHRSRQHPRPHRCRPLPPQPKGQHPPCPAQQPQPSPLTPDPRQFPHPPVQLPSPRSRPRSGVVSWGRVNPCSSSIATSSSRIRSRRDTQARPRPVGECPAHSPRHSPISGQAAPYTSSSSSAGCPRTTSG